MKKRTRVKLLLLYALAATIAVIALISLRDKTIYAKYACFDGIEADSVFECFERLNISENQTTYTVDLTQVRADVMKKSLHLDPYTMLTDAEKRIAKSAGIIKKTVTLIPKK